MTGPPKRPPAARRPAGHPISASRFHTTGITVINHFWMTRLDDDLYDLYEGYGSVADGVAVEKRTQVGGLGRAESVEDVVGPLEAVTAPLGVALPGERPAQHP